MKRPARDGARAGRGASALAGYYAQWTMIELPQGEVVRGAE